MDRVSRENRRGAMRPLSAVGESEEATSEIDAEAKLASTNATTPENNKFEILCDGVVNSLSEVQASMQDLLQLKDSLLLHYLPPPMLFRLAITVGKVYRAFSDMNTPVNELVRLVRIYSLPWDQNSMTLKRLHEMYETKKQMLNVAIKRLTLVDKKTKLFDRDKRIQNWEKLYVKLSEAKGHGRRWKFHIETFKKKASQGYDELLRWIKSETDGTMAEIRKNIAENKSAEKSEPRESAKTEKSEDSEEDDKLEESVADIESDDESFLTKSSRLKSAKKPESAKPPLPTTVDNSTQTQPDLEDKQTWTGEPDYVRYFIVRLYKPSGISLPKLKCKIKLGGVQFVSKYLDPPKPEKKVKIAEKTDNVKKKGRLFGTKGQKDKKPEEAAAVETEVKAEEDAKTFQDFVFTIDDKFKRKEILDTSTDNSVTFEMMHGDEESIFAHVILQMDDLHSLDLPVLYYKMPSEVTVIDFYQNGNKDDEASTESLDLNNWLKFGELTDEAKNTYDMLSQRQPLSFPMYKEKTLKTTNNESIGNLPLMLFWARKPIINRFDKNTGTQSIRDIVEEHTGFDIHKINRFEIEQLMHKNMRDSMCSPMSLPPPPRPPSTPVGILKMSIEEVDSMQEKHAKDLQNVQESYQLQIDQLRLTISELEDELSQLRSVHELKNESADKARSKRSIRFKPDTASQKNYQPARAEAYNNRKQASISAKAEPFKHRVSIYGKDLPQDFLERLKMFNDKSTAHHKDLVEKYFAEEASIREQQMSVQHRLDPSKPTDQNLEDFCLPAVFMPYKTNNNVFNPKAHQYFHPTGYADLRLTQPPSVFQLPPLPSKSVPVINLFELSKRYQSGEPDYYINQYINAKLHDKTINDELSMYSSQKPNSLASKNNTAMRLNLETDETNNADDDIEVVNNAEDAEDNQIIFQKYQNNTDELNQQEVNVTATN